MDVGFSYIFSPIVLVLFVITVVSVIIGLRQTNAIAPEGEVASGSKRAPLIFLLALTGYLIVSFFNASMISDRLITDKFFPLLISAISILACLYLLFQMRIHDETAPIFADGEHNAESADFTHGLWSTLSWFGMLLVFSSLLGFFAALTTFLLSFLRIRAQLAWPRIILLSACGLAFICFLAWILNRDFPPGLLQSTIELPWPLGTDKTWIRG